MHQTEHMHEIFEDWDEEFGKEPELPKPANTPPVMEEPKEDEKDPWMEITIENTDWSAFDGDDDE